MQTDRFIARVNRSCPALEPDAAHACTLIAIESLCEHLPAEQTRRMAAQLPDELARAVSAGGDRGETTDVPIALADFHDRLKFRTELSANDTQRIAAAVAQTLALALSDGQADDMAFDLPPELDQLLAR